MKATHCQVVGAHLFPQVVGVFVWRQAHVLFWWLPLVFQLRYRSIFLLPQTWWRWTYSLRTASVGPRLRLQTQRHADDAVFQTQVVRWHTRPRIQARSKDQVTFNYATTFINRDRITNQHKCQHYLLIISEHKKIVNRINLASELGETVCCL